MTQKSWYHDFSWDIIEYIPPFFLIIPWLPNLDITETSTVNKFYSKSKVICVLKNIYYLQL